MPARNGASEKLTPEVLNPLVAEGLSMNQIGKLTGFSHLSVMRAMKKHGIKPTKTPQLRSDNYAQVSRSSESILNSVFK